MIARIRDVRQVGCIKIKDMPDGTWFITNLGLFLKVSQDVCVDIASGKRMPFNEQHEAQPVEVEVTIFRDLREPL